MMPTLLQINTALNSGSTGRIAEGIGLTAKNNGWDCYVAHGSRYKNVSQLQSVQIGNFFNEIIHGGWYSLLCDYHGLGSIHATECLIKKIDTIIKPDVIHLHNIHGYYLNYRVLFEYLQTVKVPVVWTLHDCWAFTGHCVHFDLIKCNKWQTDCFECPQRTCYPRSLILDHSFDNYQLKKRLFASLSGRLTIVPVSNWLARLVEQSFLKDSRIQVIHNGIDIESFAPSKDVAGLLEKNQIRNKIILGVAAPWSERKGLLDFIKLRSMLSLSDYTIVLIGLTAKQIAKLPKGIIGFERTQNIQELAKWYSAASVFFNPTYEDNYPTVNLEAIACGTPVVTYRTGGSPEAINNTGMVVSQGDLTAAIAAIKELCSEDQDLLRMRCRRYAELNFDREQCFRQYLDLYNTILN